MAELVTSPRPFVFSISGASISSYSYIYRFRRQRWVAVPVALFWRAIMDFLKFHHITTSFPLASLFKVLSSSTYSSVSLKSHPELSLCAACKQLRPEEYSQGHLCSRRLMSFQALFAPYNALRSRQTFDGGVSPLSILLLSG